jgi:hypothetical protein
MVVLIGGTGGTTRPWKNEPGEHRSHWSHPAVPPVRTKILCSTTGTTGPIEKLAKAKGVADKAESLTA